MILLQAILICIVVLVILTVIIGTVLTMIISGVVLLVTGGRLSKDKRNKVALRICIGIGAVLFLIGIGAGGVIVKTVVEAIS